LYDPDVVMHHLKGLARAGGLRWAGRHSSGRSSSCVRPWRSRGWRSPSLVDGGDRIAARYVWRGEGRGPNTEMEFTFVFTLRNGKVVSEEHFWDHAEALEAAGLSE
jgi:hypothetical protein